ncbi:hypothetical protein BGZ83_011531, partial [Gryganskiella cystojenkinii]
RLYLNENHARRRKAPSSAQDQPPPMSPLTPAPGPTPVSNPVGKTFEAGLFGVLGSLVLKSLMIDLGRDIEEEEGGGGEEGGNNNNGSNIRDRNRILQTLEMSSRDSLEELQLERTGTMDYNDFLLIKRTYPRLRRIICWKGPRSILTPPLIDEEY